MGVARLLSSRITTLTQYRTKANCDPWRYYVTRAVRNIAVNGTPVELECVNTGIRTAIPELIVTGEIHISFGEVRVALSDGTYQVPENSI